MKASNKRFVLPPPFSRKSIMSLVFFSFSHSDRKFLTVLWNSLLKLVSPDELGLLNEMILSTAMSSYPSPFKKYPATTPLLPTVTGFG
jgi:hypothetical protein